MTGELQGCGGTVNASDGVITPPRDAQGNYMPNLNCDWVIIVPDNKTVNLTISGVSIEGATPCQYDGLEVSVKV